jgi:hypothetical protein
MIRYESLTPSIPEDATYVWAKRIAPPLVYGSKFAILFQMALIPLTMSRLSIASLSGTVLDKFIPLNRAMRIHVYLGYTMICLVLFATFALVVFYGSLCILNEDEYCEKLTSEIMCTGYAIAGFVFMIGLTSYFRHRIPYEIFYAVHHLIFILYIVTVAHTFDHRQRNGTRTRSQTFHWVSATLLYYLCDRAASYLNHHYKAKLESSSATTGKGSKMVVLKMRRPTLFDFKPGQYAFLRLSFIDSSWHPFSIASGPASPSIEFYIKVIDGQSWTGKLWHLINDNRAEEGRTGSALRIEVDLMGPYGTGLVRKEDFSHALAIGSGTGTKYAPMRNQVWYNSSDINSLSPFSVTLFAGIVPMLSLFNQHVRQLTRLDPESRRVELLDHQKRLRQVELAESQRKKSIAKKVKSCYSNRAVNLKTRQDTLSLSIHKGLDACEAMKLRNATGAEQQGESVVKDFEINRKEMKKAAFSATRSIYGVVILAALSVFGIMLIALTISWNTNGFEIGNGMVTFLEVSTVLFQLSFAAAAFLLWDGGQLLALIDTVFCVVAPFADYFWFEQYECSSELTQANVARYCILIGYMSARFWSTTVKSRHRSWKRATLSDGVASLERLELVWICRSTSLASELLPIMNETWCALVECWGEENAHDACRLQIYITSKDEVANEQLRRELENNAVYQSGAIRFGRPDLGKIVEDHTLNLIATHRSSCSVLAFCGSPELSLRLHKHKISNDMLTAITGNKRHQMEYVYESYGGMKKSKPKQQPTDEGNKSATMESSVHSRDTFSTQATLIDDEELKDDVELYFI